MNINNQNNINLNKINGEYVKFYVTTNSSLPEILKNSGAIIIYNDTSNISSKNSYTTNYIYLGNQLIASGWGLDTEELKLAATYICNNWDSFNNKFNSTYEYINNEIYDLNDIIHNKLIYSNGNITNTYVNYNNTYNLSTHDAIFNTIESDYKPLEIIDETNIIKYYDYPENIDSIEKIEKSKNAEPIYLPIGSKVSSVEKTIKYKFNDDDPYLSYAGFRYSYYTASLFNNHNDFDKNVSPLLDICTINKLNNKLSNNVIEIDNGKLDLEVKYDLEIKDDNKTFIVKEGNQEIIKDICIQTNGTNLNNLKHLSYINGTNIYELDVNSVAHIKPKQTINSNSINIIGVPTGFTYNCQTNINDDSILSIKDIEKYGERIKLEKTTKFKIKSNTKVFYLALPENSIIEEIYYIDNISNNNKINITSNFIKLNNNEKNYLISKYPNIKINNKYTDINEIYYDLYCCRYLDNFSFIDSEIFVTINNFSYNLNTYKKTSVDTDEEKNSIIPNFSYYDIVKNENYLTKNWIYGEEDKQGNNIFFKFMGNKYIYYASNNIVDDTYINPVNNYNNFKKFDIQKIYNNGKIIDLNGAFKYLIIPYEIFINNDFYSSDETLADSNFRLKNKEQYVESIFTLFDEKFVKLNFKGYSIRSIQPNIKICATNINLNQNNINNFLDNSGLPYNEFISNYFDKSIQFKEIYGFADKDPNINLYHLYFVFPIFIDNPIEFKIINTTYNTEIYMNNIFSKRINNVLYGIYESLIKINKNDILEITQMNNK